MLRVQHAREQGQGTAQPELCSSMQSSAALAVSMLLQNSIKAREPAGAQRIIKYRLVLELITPTSLCHTYLALAYAHLKERESIRFHTKRYCVQ
jgi:branched-subunit amino acid permease